MDNEQLLKGINLFIEKVNRNDKISVVGLRNTDFPDTNIARLHNNLGNAKQYISNKQTAFNGTEQTLSLKYGQESLKKASDELFVLYQRQVLNRQEYESLSITIHELDDLLKDTLNPQY